MKFGIDIGHNVEGDSGAIGIRKEDDLVMEVGKLLIAKLKSAGHEIVECKPVKARNTRDSLVLRCETANRHLVDVFVSLHFNCFNSKADGSEIFAVSVHGRNIASFVLQEIVALGFKDRKVKDGGHLYVLNNTNAPAILVECCFCDSPKDMKIYNAELMAEAICKGLLKAA